MASCKHPTWKAIGRSKPFEKSLQKLDINSLTAKSTGNRNFCSGSGGYKEEVIEGQMNFLTFDVIPPSQSNLIVLAL